MKTLPKLVSALAAAAALTACEARFGNDAAPVAENATAAGRAEEGRLTVEAPGFNMSIDIPESISSRAQMDGENGLIYPGSTLGGLHVQGRPEGPGGQSDGEVEMRFTTADPAATVAAWYRDPARAEDLTIQAARQEGSTFVIQGTGLRDQERFTVRISPRAGGGAEARLVLSDGS
ncbi:MAG TPA: hypothetical protein VN231_12795 [Allosphingosinicella sp.]|nr:hypothetical protein [Allosphingosinicella sp.]